MHNIAKTDQIFCYQIHSRQTSILDWLSIFVFGCCFLGITILNGCLSHSTVDCDFGSDIKPPPGSSGQFIDCDFDPEIETFFHNIKGPRPGLVESGGHLFALLIGIDEYNNIVLVDLDEPEKEITQLSQILRTQGYNVKSLKGKEVTIENVRKWLECFKQKLNITDRLLFYFAGHAQPLSDVFKYVDSATREKYYKQYKQINSQGSENSDDKLFLMFRQACPNAVSNFVEVDEIARHLNDSPANQKIMIIDACYGGIIDKIFHLPMDVFSHRLRNDGFFALTSAKRPVQDGWTAPFFFEALRGAANNILAGNKDGFVSLYEATIYMDHKVHQVTRHFIGEPYKSRYIFVGSGEVRMTTVHNGS